MTRSLTQLPAPKHRTSKRDVCARLWPNGEAVIWKQKTFKPDPLVHPYYDPSTNHKMARLRLHLTERSLEAALAVYMGLSPLTIFDSEFACVPTPSSAKDETRAVKGLKGITSYGARMVRNAAHVLEHSVTKGRCIFATVTCPPLPEHQLAVIHENWDKVTEYYRLGIRRCLERQGLSGELVTVSEIQTKRYERTGFPVLHLHSVFVGVTNAGRFAVSIEDHDDIWHRALSSVVPLSLSEVSSACNLQRVKKSASGYLGKYMTKGVKDIEAIVAAGYESWLPKHWWNCSRTLSQRVKAQTRRIDELADWLDSTAQLGCREVWKWHRTVDLELEDGTTYSVARYGALTQAATNTVREFMKKMNSA